MNELLKKALGSSPEVDKLYQALQTTSDPTQKSALLDQIRTTVNNSPMFPASGNPLDALDYSKPLRLDIETTGLRRGFGNRVKAVGLVQLAVQDAQGLSVDYHTDIHSAAFRKYRSGEFGTGIEATRRYLDELTTGKNAFQKGIYSLVDPATATDEQLLNENTVAGVFRRHVDVQKMLEQTDVSAGTTMAKVSHLPGVGLALHQFDTSVDKVLDDLTYALDKKKATFKGWNFAYDMGELVAQAAERNHGGFLVAASEAMKEGRLVDEAAGFQEALFLEAFSRPGAKNFGMFHRAKVGAVDRKKLEETRRQLQQALKSGEDFDMEKFLKTGVAERHPGFERMIPEYRKHLLESIPEEQLNQAASYQNFRSFAIKESFRRNDHHFVQHGIDQTFKSGLTNPDIRYTAGWSLGTVYSALGIDEDTVLRAGRAEGLEGLSAAHSALRDNPLAESVSRIGEAWKRDILEETGYAQRDAAVQELYDFLNVPAKSRIATGRSLSSNLMTASAIGMLDKTLEHRALRAADANLATANLHNIVSRQGTKYGAAPAVEAAAEKSVEAVKTNAAKKAFTNFITKHPRTSAIAGLAGLTGLVSGFLSGGRATPETAEPILTGPQIAALPPTMRGDYVHGLMQAEMMRQGLAGEIEAEVSVDGKRGYVDVMAPDGTPIEIKTADMGRHMDPMPEHVKQLSGYIRATQAAKGELTYVDYKSGMLTHSHGIMGLRNPATPYQNSFGIRPSFEAVSSDFRSGRSWYLQALRAAELKEKVPRVAEHLEAENILAEGQRRLSDVNRTTLLSPSAGPSIKPRTPNILPLDQGAKVDGVLRPGYIPKSTFLPEETPYFGPPKNFRQPRASYWSGAKTNTDTYPLIRPGKMVGAPPVAFPDRTMRFPAPIPRITGSKNPVYDTQNLRGVREWVHTVSSKSGFSTPSQPTVAPQIKLRQFSPIDPTEYRHEFRDFTPPMVGPGPGTYQVDGAIIHGITPPGIPGGPRYGGQLSNKWPFGSESDKLELTHAKATPESSVSESAPFGFMRRLMRESATLDWSPVIKENWGNRLNFAMDMADDVVMRQGFSPYKIPETLDPLIRTLDDGEKSAFFERLQKKYGVNVEAEKPGLWRPSRYKKFGTQNARATFNVLNHRLKDTARGAFGHTIQYAKTLFEQASGGRQVGIVARLQNLIKEGIFNTARTDNPIFHAAYDELMMKKKLFAQPNVIGEVPTGKLNPRELPVRRTETFFLSEKLGEVKNKWAEFFERGSKEQYDEIERQMGKRASKPGLYRNIKVRDPLIFARANAASMTRSIGRGIGQLGAQRALGIAAGGYFFLENVKDRSAQFEGTIRSQVTAITSAAVRTTDDFIAPLIMFKMMGQGAAMGSAFGPVGTALGAVGGLIAGLVTSGFLNAMTDLAADAVEAVGVSLFGATKKGTDKNTSYIYQTTGTAPRNYEHSHIPAFALQDSRPDQQGMHVSGFNMSDFGSPWSGNQSVQIPKDSGHRQKPAVPKQVAADPTNRVRKAKRSKVRDQRTRLTGTSRAIKNHVNCRSRASFASAPKHHC